MTLAETVSYVTTFCFTSFLTGDNLSHGKDAPGHKTSHFLTSTSQLTTAVTTHCRTSVFSQFTIVSHNYFNKSMSHANAPDHKTSSHITFPDINNTSLSLAVTTQCVTSVFSQTLRPICCCHIISHHTTILSTSGQVQF